MGKLYKALEKAEKERGGGQGIEVVREETIAQIPEQQPARTVAPVSMTLPEEVDVPGAQIPKPQPVRTVAPVSMKLPEEVIFPEFDDKLVAYREPGSVVSEQFRKLRTQLLTLNLPDKPKTIMVTSASEGEGKTLVSTNLATILAQDLQSHALLVDADLRNPALSRWFGLLNGRGLSDYLTGGAAIPDLLLKTRIAKLSILSSGTVRNNPVELVGSKKMESLVDELRNRYSDRYIIIDSSPLLATTEPSVLTKLVDGIILVVRAGSTPRETVKQALTTIDPAKILGVVLNDLEFQSKALNSRYFGSSRYYYRYGYGESKERGEEETIAAKILQSLSRFFKRDG
jgi:exopolysaccharide/PEP-CTERM locus tyrosine autokinase